MSQDNYQPPAADIRPNLGDDSAEDDLASFVGPNNTGYYLERYRRMKDGSSLSWHWPAFFLTGGWLLYRKMWLLALGYLVVLPFLVVMLMGLAAALIHEAAGSVIYVLYVVSLFTVVPLYANKLYLSRAKQRIDRINGSGYEEQRRRRLIERSGGTSLVAALVLMIVPLAGILAAIAIPAYQDYTIRAQVSEGLMLGNVPKIAVSEYFESEDALPYDNAEAGLGDPAEITGSYVDSVAVESGTIIITYGNDANVNIAGLSMFLVPEPLPGGGIEWSCDRGDIEQRWAPSTCR